MKEPKEPRPINFETLSLTEQLLYWGRSGNFRPNFLPNEQSTDALRQLQLDIMQAIPGAEPIEELHCTAYFCPPKKLYTFLQEQAFLDPTCTEARFYADLTNVAAVLAMPGGFASLQGDDSVTSFEIVDGKSPILALRMSETSTAAIVRERMRELLLYNLRYDVLPKGFDALREDPRFKWMVLESIPHISLANLPPNYTGIPDLTAPTELEFNGLGLGSIKHPVNNPDNPDEIMKWYLGLYPSDFDD